MGEHKAMVEVYLEVGAKRTFAGAIDWPGWCRSGRDEASALQALVAAAPRYARLLAAAGIEPPALAVPEDLRVVERLVGTATTDFGAPDVAPAGDTRPLDETELLRLTELLRACWATLDETARAVEGAALRVGPRGGGRNREAVLRHVLEAERAYIGSAGGRSPRQADEDLEDAITRTRQTALETLAAAARGEVPAVGPRGGARWPPRYFVRRVAWHVIDHAWELEERAQGAVE
jgi:hypothetical protein